uniref:Penaeidin n=1 Tax=Penaeus chinensis TaxID=139456 RepID=Q4KXB8_PENCE|nr:penaeidin [Penaeus chinensis]
MRLVVCLVFLASFALVCRGQGYKSGHTGPYPRPLYGSRPIGIRPITRPDPSCAGCRILTLDDAIACCRRLGRCCSALKG